MITIKNLTKRFGEQTLFSDLNLTIKPGEIVAIIGPSGTGKSTLLRTINSLEQADSGSVTINDVSLHYPKTNAQQRLALRQQTGFVFQNYALFQHLTAKPSFSI
ncbi:Probable amino-acid import ATP-binding protein YxeO [Photobacterium damselae]|uniref:Probable amino-acid import ATP-binding protein YxeO n=1 Tax=Photobacterium damselae TaxID=38293 RepID=A0A2X1XR89_PHODM|nr:Probable amino-acid import ATP-binding protein YxeO [Photobacterium damselae]